METRKVTIINSKTQSQKVIENSTATTLGELKAEMRANSIDYDGMTFYEGHLRAELKDDASPLPTNIPYKGTTVNDLVFMLTTPEKKVKSGTMTRSEAYAEIKRLGLQEECKNKYGKNFTQCSTDALIDLITINNTPTAVAVPSDEVVMEDNSCTNQNTCCCDNVKKALDALLDALCEAEIIDDDTHTEFKSILNGVDYIAPKKLSKSEIDTMFNFIN